MSDKALPSLLLIGADNARNSAIAAKFATRGRALRIDPDDSDAPSALATFAAAAHPAATLVLVTNYELAGRGPLRETLAREPLGGLPAAIRDTAPIAFAIARPSAVEHVRMLSLGAADVIDAGCGTDDVAQRCFDIIENASRKRVQQNVAATQATLTALMEAASSGGVIDIGRADEASELMLDAIRHDGIERWISTVARVHSQTYRHSLLMAGVTAGFLVGLGVGTRDSARLTSAALVHDVGKARLSLDLLDKPARLSADELVQIRRHPVWGYEMLLAQGETDRTLLAVTRHHHEYLDGSGYPDGLSGKRIGDAVRIATICDIFTALIEPRAYKPSLAPQAAFVTLQDMGDKLDPDLLEVFERQFLPHVSEAPVPFHGQIGTEPALA